MAPVHRWKAVLFDLGGTLLDVRNPPAWADAARSLGVDVEPDHLVHVYEEVDLEVDRMVPLPSPAEFWRRVLSRAAGEELPLEVGSQFEALGRAFPPVTHLFSDARQCLIDLKEQRRRLGIVSDSPNEAAVREHLQRATIEGFFEVVVSSGTEGVEKPNPAIFERAVARMNLAPSDAFFIGDQPHRDAFAARKAGLASVWLNRFGFGYGEDPPELTTLAELPDYLTALENDPGPLPSR